MRFAVLLAAIAALFVHAPQALAAEMWEINISGQVFGTTEVYTPGPPFGTGPSYVTTPYVGGVSFTVLVEAFTGSRSFNKQLGPREFASGTLNSDGFNVWGTDLHYSDYGPQCTGQNVCTTIIARAATFTPRVISGSVTALPPLPEPATWAMMLLGFAGIGAALRHRPRRASENRRFSAPSLPPRSKEPKTPGSPAALT